MTNKSQKNIKLYVNLTKSMLNEQLGTQDQEQTPEDTTKASVDTKKSSAEEEKLRKSTADNILRYLTTNETTSEKKLQQVIKNINTPKDFKEFMSKLNDILQVANQKVFKFGKRVLNTSKLSISKGISDVGSEIQDLISQQGSIAEVDEERSIFSRAIQGDEDAINHLKNNPGEVDDFLRKNPQFADVLKNISDRRRDVRPDEARIASKEANEISQQARKLKATHLKNLEALADRLRASRIDPIKVFSFPANADVFGEMRTIHSILSILEDFKRIGKNLKDDEDAPVPQMQYLEIITPQRMAEISKTSRKQFDKIVSTLIRGSFARASELGRDIAQAKKKPSTFAMAATGKIDEILSIYEENILESNNPADWYNKIRDPNHEYRITLDDYAKCFGLSKQAKLKIFTYMLTSHTKVVETLIDKMEKQMEATEGRCRPDPEAKIAFFENKKIIQETLTVFNETENDLSDFIQVANNFYPYSKENLGFDRPVKLRLVSDLDNSKNTFGKTAYYNPNSMEIVIYTDNRHPKDMLRSFSHELVHHAQNCRGDFDREVETDEGYAQRDPYMREKEAEAYLIGNGFMVRDYEDSLKEKNKMLSEDQIREMVRAGLKKALFENEELEETAKPDFLDLDKDGDKEESMKDTAADVNTDEVEEGDVMYEEENTSTITVESRLNNKNDFLFEKLTKKWTK